MKTIIPSDRNTFFNVRREKLQSLRRPLLRGNTIPESYRESGIYYDEKSWQPFPKVYGGAGQNQVTSHSSDRNIFFQTPIRQKPFLRKRIFKDLERGSRIVGQLAITKKERDSEDMLKGVNAIGTTLRDFISAPEVDPVTGEEIIDFETGKPKIKKYSLDELLKVGKAAMDTMFTQLGITVGSAMTIVIDGLDAQGRINVIRRSSDALEAYPNMEDDERSAIIRRIAYGERLGEGDFKHSADREAIRAASAELGISSGDEKDLYVASFSGLITPIDFKKMSKDQKGQVKSYIMAREKLTDNRLSGLDGSPIDVLGSRLVLQNQFIDDDRSLDTDTLLFY